MKPHVITREQFEKAGPCSAKDFDARATESGELVYSNGFDEAEVERVARDNPVGLMWLVSKCLVPTGATAARAAIEKAHGAPFRQVMAKHTTRPRTLTGVD